MPSLSHPQLAVLQSMVNGTPMPDRPPHKPRGRKWQPLQIEALMNGLKSKGLIDDNGPTPKGRHVIANHPYAYQQFE